MYFSVLEKYKTEIWRWPFLRFDERKVLIIGGILFMILGRFIMFPIPGGDLPPIPVDDSPTTVNPMWNDTTPNPGFYETVNSSKLSFQFSTYQPDRRTLLFWLFYHHFISHLSWHNFSRLFTDSNKIERLVEIKFYIGQSIINNFDIGTFSPTMLVGR